MLKVSGNYLTFNGKIYRCAIGKGGFSDHKREGDGATPLGVFELRECWYRADKISAPKTALSLKVIVEDDGWCDAPESTAYNLPIKIPFKASHENLWRYDDVYDIIVPLGYNDNPVVPGKGSAIFMHVARPDYEPTEGCVALAKADLLELLAALPSDARIEIQKP